MRLLPILCLLLTVPLAATAIDAPGVLGLASATVDLASSDCRLQVPLWGSISASALGQSCSVQAHNVVTVTDCGMSYCDVADTGWAAFSTSLTGYNEVGTQACWTTSDLPGNTVSCSGDRGFPPLSVSQDHCITLSVPASGFATVNPGPTFVWTLTVSTNRALQLCRDHFGNPSLTLA